MGGVGGRAGLKEWGGREGEGYRRVIREAQRHTISEASAAQRAEYDQRANIANIGQKRSATKAEVGRDRQRQIDKR